MLGGCDFFLVAFFLGGRFWLRYSLFFLTFNKFNKILLGSFCSRYLFVVFFLGFWDLFRGFFSTEVQ